MADKIKITPEELQAQAAEMKALESGYSALFSGVSSDLKSVNSNWSANLSRNFTGKITSAQKTFTEITQDLMNGANAADTCAVTFHSIDSELAKLYCSDRDSSPKKSGSLWDSIKGRISDDVASLADGLSLLEEFYGSLPDWFTHGVDVLLPGSLKDAYTLATGLLQNDLTLEEAWSIAKNILKEDTCLGIVCNTISYALEKGTARTEKMEQEVYSQLSEGDLLGAGIDMCEGFVDTVLGGSIEVVSKAAGGTIDKLIGTVPGGKYLNKGFQYLTGLFGEGDGKGYSIGGLITKGGELVSDGIDMATDVITGVTDFVTDAVVEGGKKFVNWVGSWF